VLHFHTVNSVDDGGTCGYGGARLNLVLLVLNGHEENCSGS